MTTSASHQKERRAGQSALRVHHLTRRPIADRKARRAGKARLLSALCLGFVMSLTGSVVAQQNLPIMGEPADSTLSPVQERRIGAQFMRQIRARLPLVQDVQIAEYIQSLGDRLVASSGKASPNDFTFFIINDPTINAFAIPGGYIGVNSGLVAAMKHEEQLASVLAHEIAHVTQRHHARSFATNNRNNLSTAAAVIAAILISQASAEAGQAALAAGLAASQQTAINFTRSNEVEADRIGIEILASADYDTRAMAETFDILRRKNSLNTSGLVLEYLRTHPLDNNRIAEAADRANVSSPKQRVNSLDFKFFKARLSVLTSTDLAQSFRQYEAQHRLTSDAQSKYALALVAARRNDKAQSGEYLESLESRVQLNPFVVLLRAETAKRNQDSYDSLSALADLFPERYSIVEKQLDHLLLASKLPRALQVATRYLRSVKKPNPLAWRELADIQQQLGNDAGSHESLARYFEALDELGRASSQLQLALREVVEGSQDELRLSARYRRLQQSSGDARR